MKSLPFVISLKFLFLSLSQYKSDDMGNQQSHSKVKDDRIWSSWTEEEQACLKSKYETIMSDKRESIPEFFSKELYQSIVAKLKSTEDISVFINTTHQLIKSRDSSTVFSIFKEAQVSMETFVSWVTASAVPLWFEDGSGYKWSTSYNDYSNQHLVLYILNYSHNKNQKENNDMAWLNEDSTTQNTADDHEKVDWSTKKLNQTEFMHWVETTPIFTKLFQLVIEFVFLGKSTSSSLHKRRLEHLAAPQLQQHNKETKRLFGQDKFSSLLNPFDYYMLTLSLPANALSWSDYEKNQRKLKEDLQHKLIFSSRRDGISWQVFVNKTVGQGATLIVIKTKDGALFGGYTDEALCQKTDWSGNSSNYLFQLSPAYGAFNATSANNHYQYLCWGKKSLPNGFGMGGQFEYAGLWIDSDFIHGHSRAGPLCTTYSSPQLSNKDTFSIDEVEGKYTSYVSLFLKLTIIDSLVSETRRKG